MSRPQRIRVRSRPSAPRCPLPDGNDRNAGARQPRSASWPAGAAISSGLLRARNWLAIFTTSLALFLLRFLVPTPVAQADNRDGPRLLCGLGLAPVTDGHPLFFRYAYFEYVSRAFCAGRVPYPSSELVALEIGRLLTPVFGLRGELNMIAVGVLWCALASVGIASLVTGLRVRSVGTAPGGGRHLGDHGRCLILRHQCRAVQRACRSGGPAASRCRSHISGPRLALDSDWPDVRRHRRLPRDLVEGAVPDPCGAHLRDFGAGRRGAWPLVQPPPIHNPGGCCGPASRGGPRRSSQPGTPPGTSPATTASGCTTSRPST